MMPWSLWRENWANLTLARPHCNLVARVRLGTRRKLYDSKKRSLGFAVQYLSFNRLVVVGGSLPAHTVHAWQPNQSAKDELATNQSGGDHGARSRDCELYSGLSLMRCRGHEPASGNCCLLAARKRAVGAQLYLRSRNPSWRVSSYRASHKGACSTKCEANRCHTSRQRACMTLPLDVGGFLTYGL